MFVRIILLDAANFKFDGLRGTVSTSLQGDLLSILNCRLMKLMKLDECTFDTWRQKSGQDCIRLRCGMQVLN